MRIVITVLAVFVALAVAASAAAKVPPLYKNCTNINRKYHHGIGRAHARDHTSGRPVTTFLRSDRLYRIAMSYNRWRTCPSPTPKEGPAGLVARYGARESCETARPEPSSTLTGCRRTS
jgi:hypothetical protein